MARSDVQINIRLPAELKALIERYAKKNRRSMIAEIVDRLDTSISIDEEEAADPQWFDRVADGWRKEGDARRALAQTLRAFQSALQKQADVIKWLERAPGKDGVEGDLGQSLMTQERSNQTKPKGPATEAVQAMDKAINEHRAKPKTGRR